jgi:hypothetical protein
MASENSRRSFKDKIGRTHYDLLVGDHVRIKSTGACGTILTRQGLTEILGTLSHTEAKGLLERLSREYHDPMNHQVYFVLTNALTVRVEGGDIEPDNLS